MKFLLSAVAAICLSVALVGCENNDMSTMNATPGAVAENCCGTCDSKSECTADKADLGAVGEKDCSTKCCPAACDDKASKSDASLGAVSEKDCSTKCCPAKCDGAKTSEASLGAVSEKDCSTKCCPAKCDGEKTSEASLGAVSDCPASKSCGSSCAK